MNVCIVDDCNSVKYCRSYCKMHYSRWKRHGDPNIVKQTCAVPVDVTIRIAAKSKREGDCIVFTAGSVQRSGHRQIHFNGTMRLVHRVVWQLANGPIPDGLVICHRCDNPPCVKIEHLFLGTVADNNRDRDEKGRHRTRRGSAVNTAKLTEYQVAEIKVHLLAGQTTYSLARQYGVHQGAIWNIKAAKSWKQVAPASWLDALGHPLSTMPAVQRAALDKVAWPEIGGAL